MSERKTTLDRRQFLKMSGATAAGAVIATQIGPAIASTNQPLSSSVLARRQAEVTVMMGAGELSDAEIEQFQADNEGITINRIELDQTRFFAMLAAGEAPDLYRITAPELPQLIASKTSGGCPAAPIK